MRAVVVRKSRAIYEESGESCEEELLGTEPTEKLIVGEFVLVEFFSKKTVYHSVGSNISVVDNEEYKIYF